MKNILVLCTGNSCRSIIAEALVNAKLEGVSAKSAGVRASGMVNVNAKKVLEKNGIWREEYHSKTLDEVLDDEFDLIVTVCDHAKESCPMFPRPTPKIHVGFEDPDGKEYEAFEATYDEINKELLPQIKEFFEVKKEVSTVDNVVNVKFSGFVTKEKIETMINNCKSGQCECMSDESKAKIKDMKVSGVDGDVKLELSGDISEDEIKEALSRSKVVN